MKVSATLVNRYSEKYQLTKCLQKSEKKVTFEAEIFVADAKCKHQGVVCSLFDDDRGTKAS